MKQLLILVAVTYSAVAEPPTIDVQRAAVLVAERQYGAALDIFEQALTNEPDNLRYGNDYRQAVIQANAYDRCLKFFEKLVAANPQSANVHLNYGFAYVDKIPAAGSITQVILANSALNEFTKAVELQPSWIAYYTRGNSYLFWPRIFNRTGLGIADLEQAVRLQQAGRTRSFHARAWVSLGDGYWKTDRLDRARAIWQQGLQAFPDDVQLRDRLAKTGDALKKLIEDTLDPNRRVNTDLSQIWAAE
jgi:tetratricopeptide (TPR) repeat protein